MGLVKTVQEIYQAFGRGDVAAILSHLAENVEWEYGVTSTDVPWLQPRRGREQVPEFFKSLAAIELHKFAPKMFLEADSLVVVLVDIEATVRETGRRVVEEDEVLLHVRGADAEDRPGEVVVHRVEEDRDPIRVGVGFVTGRGDR